MSKGFPFSFPKKNTHFSAHILKLSNTNFKRFMFFTSIISLSEATNRSVSCCQPKLTWLSESEHKCIDSNTCTYINWHSKVDFNTKYFCCICFYVTLLCKVVEQMWHKTCSTIFHFMKLFKLKQRTGVKITNTTQSHHKVTARWLVLHVHHRVSGKCQAMHNM